MNGQTFSKNSLKQGRSHQNPGTNLFTVQSYNKSNY